MQENIPFQVTRDFSFVQMPSEKEGFNEGKVTNERINSGEIPKIADIKRIHNIFVIAFWKPL